MVGLITEYIWGATMMEYYEYDNSQMLHTQIYP